MTKVSQILRKKGNGYWSVPPGMTAFTALQIMAEKDIGALLVVESGKITGIFSERDYARKVILMGRSSKDTPVADLMSSPVCTIPPEGTIAECMEIMTARKHRHLPVVERGVIVGVISIGDVVSALISDQKTQIRDLENFICGSDIPVEAEHAETRS